MILDLLKARSQARADQRGFAGARTADNGNEMFLRDLRFKYIEFSLAPEKKLMVALLEESQSSKRPFVTGKFRVRAHDVVPKSRRAFPNRVCHTHGRHGKACPAMWVYLNRRNRSPPVGNNADRIVGRRGGLEAVPSDPNRRLRLTGQAGQRTHLRRRRRPSVIVNREV
jgi:hypothetical protein